jgi:predicted O-linked N-acetylglucosamine transferase (SPINDLY family)/Flp pilus assembly protein TadD
MSTAVEPSNPAELAALAGEFVATLETLSARGLHDSAEALARQMIAILPGHAAGWQTLAYAHLRRGDLLGALEPLEHAARLLPGDAELQRHAHAARAMRDALVLDQRGDYPAAGKLYETVLAAYPDYADANHRLGVIAIRLLQPKASLPYLERAIGANPNQLQYWANYIDGLLQSDQLDAAWIALEMAQQRGLAGPEVDRLIGIMTYVSTHETAKVPRPADPGPAPSAEPPAQAQQPPRPAPAQTPAGPRPAAPGPTPQAAGEVAALFNTGRFHEALERARDLTQRFPEHGFGWKVVAAALFRVGHYFEAAPYAEKAYELWPDDVDVLQIKASLLESEGKHSEAEAVCRRLLELRPDHAEGLRILSIVLGSMGRLDEAEQVCRRAVELDPQSWNAPSSLGVTLMQQGRLSEAITMFRRALDINPDFEMAHNNLAFCLTHSEDVAPAELFAEHRRFAERFEAPVKPLWPQHRNTKDPERRLRVGFISGDFCRHAVASFFEPVLEHLARDTSLSLYAFSNTPRSDGTTAKLRTMFEVWHDLFGATDEAVAQRVLDDEIDILVDLAGHTAHNRLRAMARKPAPLQASWIGYPGTTGLDAVDYFLADRFWVPSDLFRSQFSEKIAYLPALAAFQADPVCPPVNLLPALRNGYVTFGSFNRMDKLRRDVIALWSRLMRELPGSRMLIGAMPRDASQDKLAAWFAEEGIARERLDFRPRSSVPAYLQQHHHIDFCLDSFPFSGLTTALHSLWMGVPTLTLPSQTVPGRSGITAMSHVGLQSFVAADQDDFVRKGVAIAGDLPALAALRASLRERCAQSPMYQPDAVAACVSQALRTMWRRWCAGLPAESFSIEAANAPAPAVLDKA